MLPDGTSGASKAEQVYKRLLVFMDNARTRRNLQILWTALEKMRLDEVPDYNAARVGKYSAELGGIRAQSIRNANGERFRQLIDAYAATAGKSRSKAPVRAPSNVELAIERVTDNGARTALKMMLVDRRRLQDENNKLRSAFKRLPVVTTNLHRSEPDESQTERESSPPFDDLETIDEIHLAAVERFLSDDWLEERAWVIEPDGSMVDNATVGDLIAPPGFVDALRQFLRKRGADLEKTGERNGENFHQVRPNQIAGYSDDLVDGHNR